VLGPETDRHPAGLAVGVGEVSLGLDPGPREKVEAVECDGLALEGVVDAGLAEVVEDRLLDVGESASTVPASRVAERGGRSASSTRWGERLSTVNRPVSRTFLRSS
jgi:hypothetical protein